MNRLLYIVMLSKKLFCIVILVLVIQSCGIKQKYSIRTIETLMNVSIAKDVEFSLCEEQWTDFNGDGYRICVFDIKDTEALYSKIDTTQLERVSQNKHELEREVHPYINGNTVYYYKVVDHKGDTDYVILDVETRKLIHFYFII